MTLLPATPRRDDMPFALGGDRSSYADDAIGDLEARIDRVIEENRVVAATPERDLAEGRRVRFPDAEPWISEDRHARLRADAAPGARDASALGVERVAMDTMERDAARARRRARVDRIAHVDAVPMPRPTILTREGVLHVDAAFRQAPGIGEVLERRLWNAGIRTAERFIKAPLDELTEITALDTLALERAKHDIDLTHAVLGDRAAADLLRVAGVHTVSRLADRDVATLSRDLQALVARRPGLRLPATLVDDAAVADTIRRAAAILD